MSRPELPRLDPTTDPAGHSHVRHYRDPRVSVPIATLKMGAAYVAQRPQVLTTILGSCVALCLYAPEQHMAGMNHYLLPSNPRGAGPSAGRQPDTRYGDESCRFLLNRMIGLGAEKEKLIAKLFGGGKTMQGSMCGVGQQNVDLALHFLTEQEIEVKAIDVGGSRGRRILFDSRTGKVFMTHLRNLLVPRTPEEETRISNSLGRHPLADVSATDLMKGM